MIESTQVITVTKKSLELDQSEVEGLIKGWLGDSSNTEWKFDFDFDNYGDIKVIIHQTITELEKVSK
jgi:hypothetical protein